MTTKINKQQAFTIAVQGLYAQGKPAANDKGYCQYRAKETGFKCGVGFLIPDSVYQRRFESLSASRLFQDEAPFKEIFDPEIDHTFLTVLQTDLHDNYVEYAEELTDRNEEAIPYKRWLMQAAEDFAKIHGLELPEFPEEKESS